MESVSPTSPATVDASSPAGSVPTPGRAGEVRAGLGTVLPAAVAIACTGGTFGVLVIQSGLPWWWAPLCQAVVFAGSLEFVLVGLVVAAAPLGTVALTSFLLNSRHFFYSLSFPLDRVRGRLTRVYSIHTMTEEADCNSAADCNAAADGATGDRTDIGDAGDFTGSRDRPGSGDAGHHARSTWARNV